MKNDTILKQRLALTEQYNWENCYDSMSITITNN